MIATAAAGVVVSKLGTATCTIEELLTQLQRRAKGPSAGDRVAGELGLTPLETAIALRQGWGRAGLKVGFANGCFDLLHPGHVTLLREAARACDRLIVAINSDASTRALKGPTRPVQTQDARAQVLKAIKGVDMVVVFDDPTPLALVEALVPDVIVKGSDYAAHEVVGGEVVVAHGGSILLVDLVSGHSTSSLVRKAQAGDQTGGD